MQDARLGDLLYGDAARVGIKAARLDARGLLEARERLEAVVRGDVRGEQCALRCALYLLGRHVPRDRRASLDEHEAVVASSMYDTCPANGC